MFRVAASKLLQASRSTATTYARRHLALTAVRYGDARPLYTEDDYAIKYFDMPHIDGWQIRQMINTLQGEDAVPEPSIIIACLKACRRVNDYSLAVRWLEAVKLKCGRQVNEIWPYLLQEIRPTLDELGVDTPEELGYDKPELALVDVYELHDKDVPSYMAKK